MTSTTLRAAYHLAGYGLLLLLGLVALSRGGADSETVRAYADLAVVVIGSVGMGLGVYGARHFPLPGRLPTSRERGAQSGPAGYNVGD